MPPVASTGSNLWGSAPHNLPSLFLLFASVLGAYVCYRLVLPFTSPLAWALTLTILLLPFHRWMERRLGNPAAAASISVALAGLIVVGPAVFVSQRLVAQSVEGVDAIKRKIDSGAVRRLLADHPRLAPTADFLERKVDLPGALQTTSAWLTGATASFVKNSVIELIRVLLTFYFLFYLLRDHREAVAAIIRFSPFAPREMERLLQQIADAIHATIYGTLVVALVQGALGGFMFWVLGLPAPLFWGFVMGLLAIAPVLGAFIIWVPAAFSLALDGSWEKALILTVWGAVVVGGIDNWLYPILIGRRLKLHSILAFIATVGGLILFGPCGLILGPVALTVTLFLLEGWWRQSKSLPASATETSPESAVV